MPAASVLANVPGVGALIRLVELRSYNTQWGDTSFQAVLPVFAAVGRYVTDEIDRQNQAKEEPVEIPVEKSVEKPVGETAGEPAEESAGNIAENQELTEQDPQVSVPQQTPQISITEPSIPVISESDVVSQPDTAGMSGEEGTGTSETEESGSETSTDPEEELSDGVNDMNHEMEEYIEQMRDKFDWYVARKYEGYVGMDTAYDILRNDDRLLSVRFYTTLNVGGSAQYSRSFTLDKETGQVLELKDLFLGDSDYIGVISGDILRQMTEQAQAGEADYFIPGGIWSDDECFKEIKSDQNFYINDSDMLVIVFDEYEVAPGSMGMPEFVIETGVLEEILIRPSILG